MIGGLVVSAGIGPCVGTRTNPGLAQLISSNRETFASSQLRCVYPGLPCGLVSISAFFVQNIVSAQF